MDTVEHRIQITTTTLATNRAQTVSPTATTITTITTRKTITLTNNNKMDVDALDLALQWIKTVIPIKTIATSDPTIMSQQCQALDPVTQIRTANRQIQVPWIVPWINYNNTQSNISNSKDLMIVRRSTDLISVRDLLSIQRFLRLSLRLSLALQARWVRHSSISLHLLDQCWRKLPHRLGRRRRKGRVGLRGDLARIKRWWEILESWINSLKRWL